MTEPIVDPDANQDESNDSGEWMVKTPWFIDEFDGLDDFPVITPQGTKMTGAQKAKALEAAKYNHITLLTKEV